MVGNSSHEWTLREHQKQAVDFLTSRPRTLLGDEPGSGKTPILLRAASGKTLVVAPAMVVDAGVWEDEPARWAPDLDLTVTTYHQVVRRVDSGRVTKTGQRITEYVDLPAREFSCDWDTLICDEAHHLKNRKAHWTLAIQRLAKLSSRVILATGTPISNWGHELFPLLQILHPDQSKPGQEFGSYWKWAERWFPVGPQYSRKGRLLTHHHITPRMRACPEDCPGEVTGQCEHWQAFRAANLDGLVIARSWDDLGFSLPPLTGWLNDDGTPCLFKVKMGAAQRKVYNALKKDFVAWTESGGQIEAWSVAGLQTKLRQVAVGLEVADPNERGSAKLDAMQELLVARGRPTVVIAVHHATMDAIATRVVELGLNCREVSGRTPSSVYRRDTIKQFQDGGIDVLIGQVDTVSEGLTLTRADGCIMVESSYRPDRNEQVIRKLYRLGQDRPVHVDRMVTINTIDQSVMEILHQKRGHILAAMPPGEYARLL